MKKVAIIVETRKHKALPFVLNNVMSILPKDWSLQIFHGISNLDYIEEVIEKDNFLNNIKDKIVFNNLNIESITADDSSLDIMLTEKLWGEVVGEVVLYFECDSMLCAESEYKVSDFEHFNYIGGYWGNQLYDLDGKYPVVMNGGVSIRKKEFMLDIIKNELQPYLESGGNPCEDYFVTECVSHLDMPTTKEVLSFSIDNGYMAPLDMKPPFALHKPWGVNSAKGHGLFYNRIKEVCSGVEELERLNDGL
jgi:hypothetical protein